MAPTAILLLLLLQHTVAMQAPEGDEPPDPEKIDKWAKRSAEITTHDPEEEDDPHESSSLSSVPVGTIKWLCGIKWSDLPDSVLKDVPGNDDERYNHYWKPQSWLYDKRNPLANKGRLHLGL